jgi:Tfp pilus assembly protein PilV
MIRRGNSIFEVVVAFTLLAVAGLALLNLMPSTWLATRSTEQRLQAGEVAQSTLEQFRAGDLQDRTAYRCDPILASGTEFYPTVSVGAIAGKPNLKRIQVEVAWKGSKNRTYRLGRQLEVFWLPP